MIPLITSIIPWEWIGGAVAACLAIAGVWVAGGKSQRQKTKIDAQSGWIKTTKAVQDVEISDDIGVLRERMRERDPRKP